jgi:hypothetical protein
LQGNISEYFLIARGHVMELAEYEKMYRLEEKYWFSILPLILLIIEVIETSVQIKIAQFFIFNPEHALGIN